MPFIAASTDGAQLHYVDYVAGVLARTFPTTDQGPTAKWYRDHVGLHPRLADVQRDVRALDAPALRELAAAMCGC